MAQHSTVRVRGGQVTCMWGTKILQLVFFLRLSEVECLEPFILLIWNAYLKNLIPNLLPLYFREDVEELLFSPIWFSISPIRRCNLGRTKVYPLCEYLHIRWCSEQWVSAQAKNVLRIFPHCSSLFLPPHFQKGNAQLSSCFEAELWERPSSVRLAVVPAESQGIVSWQSGLRENKRREHASNSGKGVGG